MCIIYKKYTICILYIFRLANVINFSLSISFVFCPIFFLSFYASYLFLVAVSHFSTDVKLNTYDSLRKIYAINLIPILPTAVTLCKKRIRIGEYTLPLSYLELAGDTSFLFNWHFLWFWIKCAIPISNYPRLIGMLHLRLMHPHGFIT